MKASVLHPNLASPHNHHAPFILSSSKRRHVDSKRCRSRDWACRGMGRAIALRLALDGYDIALNDIPAQETALRATAEEVASRGCRVVHCGSM